MKTKYILLAIVSVSIAWTAHNFSAQKALQSVQIKTKTLTQQPKLSTPTTAIVPKPQPAARLSHSLGFDPEMPRLNRYFFSWSSPKSWKTYIASYSNKNLESSRYYWRFIKEINHDAAYEQWKIINTRPEEIKTIILQKQRKKLGLLYILVNQAKKHAAIGGQLENEIDAQIEKEKDFIRNALIELKRIQKPKDTDETIIKSVTKFLEKLIDKDAYEALLSYRIAKNIEQAKEKEARAKARAKNKWFSWSSWFGTNTAKKNSITKKNDTTKE